jgi:hypothetical protein
MVEAIRDQWVIVVAAIGVVVVVAWLVVTRRSAIGDRRSNGR